jgi:hypothetical protein
MKFCSKCGKELAEDSKFCTICGTPSGGDEASAATPVAPTAPAAPAAPNAAVVAASTAISFFKQFIKAPATAIKTNDIKGPEAIIYLALLPLSMFLLLYAFIWRMTTDIAIAIDGSRRYASEIREELGEFFSWGTAAFETILHVAVWFVLLLLVPFVLFKFFGTQEKVDIGKIFPVFAAATIPYTALFVIGAIITFLHMTAGTAFLVTASMALGSVAFWILHATAVKRCFNATTEQAVYSSIITYVIATMYSLFGVWRVVGVLFDDLFGGFGGLLGGGFF